MTARQRPAVLVVGLGNELAGDDRFGIEVARRLHVLGSGPEIELLELVGEPIQLLEHWRDRRLVVIVDAMRADAPLGTIKRIEVGRDPLPGHFRGTSSTHAIGLRDAIELARAIGQLPPSVTVYAVQGRSFEAGSELCPEVSDAVDEVAAMVLDEALR